MVYITGDTHGRFERIIDFCRERGTSREDILIILGDSCFNYYGDKSEDNKTKLKVKDIPITFFCIQGNHEQRAELIPEYKKIGFWDSEALIEDEYPNIIFGLDGNVYKVPTLQGIKDMLVIGGAYTIDSWYRKLMGIPTYPWHPEEQPSNEMKRKIEGVLKSRDYSIDIILSHTCPNQYIQNEWLLKTLNQDEVDRSLELWLDRIQNSLRRYDRWYCGHYHGDKKIDKMTFMFNKIEAL